MGEKIKKEEAWRKFLLGSEKVDAQKGGPILGQTPRKGRQGETLPTNRETRRGPRIDELRGDSHDAWRCRHGIRFEAWG